MWLRLTLILLLPTALAACDRVDATVDTPALKRAARTKYAEDLAAQPPKRTVHHLEHGDLVVLDIATVGPGGFTDSQKCFVWRDTEFKTASMQCPSNSEGNLPDLPAAADSGPNY